MANNLNPVEATVTVAGQPVHFTQLSLFQKFNAHHHFTIEIDFEEFGGKWMDNPVKMINFIGLDVNIDMKHRETGESNLFTGIITNISHSGYHGQQNSIIVSGCSPTIKLAGKPTMNSFMDLPLQQIVNEAVADSGNGGAVIVNPVFGSKLDYVCQYDENCFDFLNRLSWEFGEWHYYNGINSYFGLHQGDNATIEYDKEMTYFDLSANLVPGKFNRYHYLQHDNREIDKDEPERIPGERGYLIVSKRRSESLYTSVANSPLNSAVNTKKDLDDLVKAERGRDVGEMLIMRGKTKTCKVKIGGTVTIKLPDTMDVTAKSVDTFLVTQVSHVIDQEGHYSNSFEGIIAGIEVIPMEEPKIPIANPQIAWVNENVDAKERGRIKVQFQWQKKLNKTTNWIRVQTVDAGTSKVFAQNRGHVFIPETDDQVMVGFEYGDPSRPYMMGSMFPERHGKGGEVDNNIKSIKTRSGHRIEFNDSEGNKSITITDIAGNIIFLDTVGDQIKIHAPKKVTITSEDIEISASKSLVLSSGKDTQQTVGAEFNQTIAENHSLSVGQSMNVSVEKHMKMQTSTGNVNVQSGEEILESAKSNVKITSGKKTDIISQSDVTIQSGTDVFIAK